MREKLVQLDLVECVIGLGKNLFYNSPMEACIVICNTRKATDHKNKILFINAKHEVTRKNAQSYLEDSHIEKIAGAYSRYEVIDDFSYIATLNEISKNDCELTISLYVTDDVGTPAKPIEVSLPEWVASMRNTRNAYDRLNSLLVGGENNA